MSLSQIVKLRVWLLMGFNLLMALGCIWIFMRMAPAIAVILERNERSLHACEEMLAALALINNDEKNNKFQSENFMEALKRARNNVTEPEEPTTLQTISASFEQAFFREEQAIGQTVTAVINLGRINREAMNRADHRARQLGYAGAWGVVFMAIGVFLIGIRFNKKLFYTVVSPLEEIYAVISAQRTGNVMRRCTGTNLPGEIRIIFSGINEILNKCQSSDL
jgi:hypothetical protein